MNVFDVLTLLGGLAMFLYGMRLMGDSLKDGSSGTLRVIMSKVTDNPVKAFLLGLFVTAVIQSSTATIVITSGLVGAGILTLRQSLGIIVGANVGTTVTGQIIRLLDVSSDSASWLQIFKPSTLAPVALIIGIIVIMANLGKSPKTVGGIALGFGILFTGLINMIAAVSPLSESPAFRDIIERFSQIPVLGFVAGFVITFIIQSSSASIGILQAICSTGMLTFGSVYGIIIGMNFGASVTAAVITGIGAKKDGKRVGIVHVAFTVLGGIIVAIALMIVRRLGVTEALFGHIMTSGDIANFHSLFNIVSALILLPFTGSLEKLTKRIIKDDKHDSTESIDGMELLDKRFFISPSLALSQSTQTAGNTAIFAQRNLIGAFTQFDHYDKKLTEEIENREELIDRASDSLERYLVELSNHLRTESDNMMLNYLLQEMTEFERIGDYSINLVEEAQKLCDDGISFSDEAMNELAIIRDAVESIVEISLEAFRDNSVNTAYRIEPLEEVIDDLVEALKSRHIDRLKNGKCSIQSGIVFLNVLTFIERISDHCSNIAVHILGKNLSIELSDQHNYIERLHLENDPFYKSEFDRNHDEYFGRLSEITSN